MGFLSPAEFYIHPKITWEKQVYARVAKLGYKGEIMGDIQKCVCKDCKVEHNYIYSHLAKSGNKIYLDEHGRQWKGKVCADCQAAIRRARYSGESHTSVGVP